MQHVVQLYFKFKIISLSFSIYSIYLRLLFMNRNIYYIQSNLQYHKKSNIGFNYIYMLNNILIC